MRLPYDFLKNLEIELEYREKVLRLEINNEVNEAASLGDIPENFPYHAAVERRTTNEDRIYNLQKLIKNSISSKSEVNVEVIEVGVRVRLLKNNTVIEIILVNSETLELNPTKDFVSCESPLGKNLIGKKIGDEIEINAPIGKVVYKVLDIT